MGEDTLTSQARARCAGVGAMFRPFTTRSRRVRHKYSCVVANLCATRESEGWALRHMVGMVTAVVKTYLGAVKQVYRVFLSPTLV